MGDAAAVYSKINNFQTHIRDRRIVIVSISLWSCLRVNAARLNTGSGNGSLPYVRQWDYQNQYWPSSMTPYGVTRLKWITKYWSFKPLKNVGDLYQQIGYCMPNLEFNYQYCEYSIVLAWSRSSQRRSLVPKHLFVQKFVFIDCQWKWEIRHQKKSKNEGMIMNNKQIPLSCHISTVFICDILPSKSQTHTKKKNKIK